MKQIVSGQINFEYQGQQQLPVLNLQGQFRS